EVELVAPAESSPHQAMLPRPTAPAQASACHPFDRPVGQVAAVTGDQLQVSPGCEAVAVVGTKEGADAGWSLVEPTGAVSPLDRCHWFELGEAGAVACRSMDSNGIHGSAWV